MPSSPRRGTAEVCDLQGPQNLVFLRGSDWLEFWGVEPVTTPATGLKGGRTSKSTVANRRSYPGTMMWLSASRFVCTLRRAILSVGTARSADLSPAALPLRSPGILYYASRSRISAVGLLPSDSTFCALPFPTAESRGPHIAILVVWL